MQIPMIWQIMGDSITRNCEGKNLLDRHQVAVNTIVNLHMEYERTFVLFVMKCAAVGLDDKYMAFWNGTVTRSLLERFNHPVE